MTEYRMPAEWEPHQSTWLSWPHNRGTWPGGFAAAERSYAEMVKVLARYEPVEINVLDARQERNIRNRLAGCGGSIRYHQIQTNDAWCRDHGATIVHDSEGGKVAVDFEYNAWGGKYPPYDFDAQVARRMASVLGVPALPAGLVLEGGAIEVNGAGIAMTTASCILNPNRNPGLTKHQAETRLKELLGVREVLWVEGELAGDDTDGHIDNLARFVGPEDILMSVPGPAGGDEALEVGLNKLRREASGLGLRVHPLPLPPTVYSPRASREHVPLPASYANFYIANNVVLIPGYDDASDALAAEIIGGFFPGRSIEVVDCRAIVWGLGAIHCLTQQVPA